MPRAGWARSGDSGGDDEGVDLGVADVLEEAVDAPLLVDVVGGAEGDALGEVELEGRRRPDQGLELEALGREVLGEERVVHVDRELALVVHLGAVLVGQGDVSFLVGLRVTPTLKVTPCEKAFLRRSGARGCSARGRRWGRWARSRWSGRASRGRRRTPGPSRSPAAWRARRSRDVADAGADRDDVVRRTPALAVMLDATMKACCSWYAWGPLLVELERGAVGHVDAEAEHEAVLDRREDDEDVAERGDRVGLDLGT
jgi:hypothetical protein